MTSDEFRQYLKERGVRALVVTGMGTAVCVESTVRDVFMADYHVRGDRALHGKVVVRGVGVPWRQNRQALVKRYLWTTRVIGMPTGAALDDWRVFVQDINVHSGKHRHQGGLVIFVLEGEGYSVVEGERDDWEAGDLLLLPYKPGGIEHQHFNCDDSKPAKWIALINSSVWDWGASEMMQVTQHPDFVEDDETTGVHDHEHQG